MTQNIHINKDSHTTFNNNAFFCIGTGRMGLALQKAYCEQLKLVQDKIGFTHIRGHGLFSDDMAIYHEYKDADPSTTLPDNIFLGVSPPLPSMLCNNV